MSITKKPRSNKGTLLRMMFIQGIMDVTKKSEASVRRWLSGSCAPDALTRDVLAKHFNTTPDELFKDCDN